MTVKPDNPLVKQPKPPDDANLTEDQKEKREKMIKQFKIDVRSILISAPIGLTLLELYRDYEMITFEKMPNKSLGYATPELLLSGKILKTIFSTKYRVFLRRF